MIVSPCISICKTDPATGYCYSYGRDNIEKKIWKAEITTDELKKSNLIEIQERLKGGGSWKAFWSHINTN